MDLSVGHGEKVERKFEQTIGALLSNGTIQAAALEIGVGFAPSWLALVVVQGQWGSVQADSGGLR